jgi:ADP-ribosyl-[dinitrogen reductase] hydrolase
MRPAMLPDHPPDARALDRARGCLLGLAVGEALGRPLEALPPERATAALAAEPRLAAGGDQAQMAALLAESLLAQGRLDPADLSHRLVGWVRGGARDVGRVAARALYLQSQGEPWADAARVAWEQTHPRGATAEALARAAPLALLAAADERALARDALAASAVTHFDPRCRWSAAALALLLARLWRGAGQGLPGAVLGLVGERHVLRALEAVPTLMPAHLVVRNEAILVLQAATWCALNEDDFAAALRRAVGLGGPTPLLGAACGALAGARFGAEAIPDTWRAALPDAGRLVALAEELVRLRPGPPRPGPGPERRNGPARAR